MRKGIAALVAGIYLWVMTVSPVWASGQAWESELENKMKWSQVTYFGTLLVGSDSGLESYNPETGERLWVRDDLKKLAPFDVREVTGYPILILGKDKGMGGTKAEIEAVSIATGESIWKSDRVNGAPLGVYTVPNDKLVLLAANVFYDETKGDGIFILCYDAENGQIKWETEYHPKAGGIPQYTANNIGTFYARVDFSGYQDPVFAAGVAYLTFKGIHALDLNTGKILWGEEFKPGHKSLKKAYAAPIIEGETVYATGSGSVYAFNKTTGELKWKTEPVRSGLVAQLVVADDMVIARIGGNFFDQAQKKFVADKPFVVKAFNKADGSELWEYADAKGGLTNIVHLPELHAVMFADAGRLIGINTQSSGEVKESFSVPLEFKRSLGATDVASAGVKAVTGGIGGMIRAGAKMAAGKDRKDPPVSVVKAGNGMVVVRGQQHILSFDPQAQTINWSLYYPAPGPSALGIALMAGVSAFAVLGSQMQYVAGQTSMSTASKSISSQFQRMDRYLDKRFTKSAGDQQNAFILTSVTEGAEEGIGITAVNLATGDTAGQFVFDEKDPEYAVDQMGDRVYFFKKKKQIIAYDL